ncbi:hypothetical protein AAU61_14435 [Desulfocarbo indianensis]|nr:hypothetical protein AAU61_14435 [Desulfocarbo indianensis]
MKLIDPSGELIYADEETLVHEQGESLIITRQEDLEPVMAQVAEARKLEGNGFSKGRTMRYLGSVPLTTLIERPELADDNELRKYLRNRARLRAVPSGSF